MEYALSLGSNLGCRMRNLQEARRRILAISSVQLVAQSPVYETQPQDVPARYRHRKFLNAVLIVESRRPPLELAAELHAVEAAMGRKRSSCRNTPRIVDVDVIYAGRRRLRSTSLVIPHPRWNQRRFVVQPLCDVRPTLQLPGEKRTVRQALKALPEQPSVRLYAAKW